MRKFLLNAYVNLNFGDDLFLKILFERYPQIYWVLPKGGQKYKQIFSEYNNLEIKKDFAFKVRRKLKILERDLPFNRYDGGVYIGGSIFMQIPEWKEQLKERKKVIKSFSKKSKPYFFIGSNFGSYNDELFYKEYLDLFKGCKDICFRDNYSKNLFQYSNNVRLAPDIVFQLKPKKIKKIKDSIGISLIEIADREGLIQYREQYISKIKLIIEQGIKNNKKFTLFSFCEAQGDLKIINEVIDSLDQQYKKDISVVNYSGNIDEFLEMFESMENIIGTRFHACILSQVFGQGLYPLIYSDKTYNVLKDIGLDKEYTYIKDIDNLDIDHLFEVMPNNITTDKSIFKEAEKQFQELDKYVSRK